MSKRIMDGHVVSDACDKTITVKVQRRFMHPTYRKFISRSKKYAVHDELNQFKIGDRVQIQECRPISKSKHWQVIVNNQ